MLEKEDDKKYLVKSIDKALRILDVIALRERVALKDICRITGYHKTSAFKMLYTMERRGFVQKYPDASYSAGEKLEMYKRGRFIRKNIVEAADAPLRTLCLFTGETAILAILNLNGRSINIHVERGRGPDAVKASVGQELDPHSVAVGKVLLAYTPEETLKRILRDVSFFAYTPHTLTTPEALYPVLEETREKGYCVDADERHMGHASVAAPVFDHQRRCIAAVALICATKTMAAHREVFCEKTVAASQFISDEMGYQPSYLDRTEE